MEMKVLQCSFLSGIRLQKVEALLRILQPKVVLLPEELNPDRPSITNSFHYCVNETFCIYQARRTVQN
ncbi:hypothetical protein C1H46_010012 [Malus baccata]|uniref:Uncharacterized protein n=1 Tax=Malus baccata TaxID=106549 RepID=A0A540N1I6_MALBA|nr:hypothetical protein C1H46_010012 [Malus baccata]